MNNTTNQAAGATATIGATNQGSAMPVPSGKLGKARLAPGQAPVVNAKELLGRLNEAERKLAEANAKLAEVAPERVAVTDEKFRAAMRKARDITVKSKGELKGTLNKVLGFAPDLTDGQRVEWRAVRKEIDKLHDSFARRHAAELRGYLARAARLPSDKALLSGKLTRTKAGKVKRVTHGAVFNLKAEAKGKGDEVKASASTLGKTGRKPAKRTLGKAKMPEAAPAPAAA
jgi:hypothetical protein